MTSSTTDTAQPAAEASLMSSPSSDRQGYAKRVHYCVGVVGLGHMGRAFGANLVADGHRVLVYDRDPERVKPLEDTGALGAARLADLAPCDVVLSSVPDDDALTAVTLGTEGLVSTLTAGAVHISMSTERHAVPMPAASLVHDRLVGMVARGWADLDWSALGLLASRDAGLQDAATPDGPTTPPFENRTVP